jgi:RHS repeat-associated protein
MQFKMKHFAAIVVSLALAEAAVGQGVPSAGEYLPTIDWQEAKEVEHRLQPLGNDLLGDQIDFNTGALSFSNTDVSIPGNSPLEVAFRRSRSQGFNYEDGQQSPLADWDLELPHISVVTAVDIAWTSGRCTNSFAQQFPDIFRIDSEFGLQGGTTVTYRARDYSNGVQLHIPGEPSMQVLEGDYNGQAPTGTPYVTNQGWRLTCLTSVAGEGFYAFSPSGVRYKFDTHITRDYRSQTDQLVGALFVARYKHQLMATEVTDVNGNWVRYEYDTSKRLTRIHASDGREITVHYSGTSQQVSEVRANGRSWFYTYRQSTFSARLLADAWSPLTGNVLSGVTLPDGRKWTYNLDAMTAEPYPGRDCNQPNVSVSVTHPSGATGQFNMHETRHRDSLLASSEIMQCATTEIFAPPFPEQPPIYETQKAEVMAVTSKQISGPGIQTATWTFEYEEDTGASGTSSADPTNWTAVTNSEGETTVHFHAWHGDARGRVARVERRDGSRTGPLLETSETTYLRETDPVGDSFVAYGFGGQPVLRPVRTTGTKITRGTDVFETITEYKSDSTLSDYSFGRPTKVTVHPSDGSTARIYDVTYQHLKTIWVLGLPYDFTQNGRLTDSLRYDSNGRVDQHLAYGVTKNAFTYHSDGTVASITDALGNTTQFANFKRGRPQSITLPDTAVFARTYDNDGRITSETNGRGYVTNYEYHPTLGFIDKIIPPKNDGVATDTVITYSYLPSVTAPDRLEQTVVHGDLTVTRNYDIKQRVTDEKHEDTANSGAVSYVSFRYDTEDRTVFESFPAATLALSATNGIETDYDALGRMEESRQTVAPLGVTQYAYLPGNKIQVTDAETNVTTTTYLSYGAPVNAPPQDGDRNVLPTLIDVPSGADFWMEYDIWGNRRYDRQILLVTTPDVATILAETEYYYTTRNLLEWMEDPAGDRDYTYYDIADRPIVQIDGANRKTRMVYDSMHRVEKLIKAWAGDNAGNGQLNCATMLASYHPQNYLQQCYQTNTYDANGNLNSVADAKGNTTSYSYDALDRGKRVTYPDTSYIEVQTYDVLSNPVKTRTRAGQIHDYKYDALSRMLAASTPDRDSRYSYDAADRRTCASVYTAGHLDFSSLIACSASSGALQHRTSYTYDGIGRLLNETALAAGAPSLTVGYQYDKLNNRTRITWPDGFYARYDYDNLNRLTDVWQSDSGTTTRLAHYGYDNQSRLTCILYGGGTDCAATPGVSRMTLAWETDSDLASLTHSFALEPDVAFTYAYDGSGKMVQEDSSNAAWIYSPAVAGTETYAPANNLNQYASVNSLPVTHDLNGNRTSYDGLSTPHDSENRLLSAAGTSYSYDADGRRTLKTMSGVATQFVHAGDMEIGEYVGGVLQHRYVPGHSVDQRVAWLNVGAATTHFYHANRLGSVQAVVSTSGSVTDRYVYSPFGIEEPLTSTGNPFRYTGRRFDPESGLFYYRARNYDAGQGRFLQPDPVGYEDQMNLYTYVHNEPLNAIDPLGKERMEIYCGRFRILCGGGESDDDNDGNDDRDRGGINLIKALFGNSSNPTEEDYSEFEIQQIYKDSVEKLREDVRTCAAEELGIGTAASASVGASGLPVIPTAPKPTGATQGTSVASVVSRRVFGDLRTKDVGGPKRVWAPTLARPLATTNKVGGAVGRWFPAIGYATLTQDAIDMHNCLESKK